jgi:hypothetical protein
LQALSPLLDGPTTGRKLFCADFVQVLSVAEAWPQALQVAPKRGGRDLNSFWDNLVKPLFTV